MPIELVSILQKQQNIEGNKLFVCWDPIIVRFRQENQNRNIHRDKIRNQRIVITKKISNENKIDQYSMREKKKKQPVPFSLPVYI